MSISPASFIFPLDSSSRPTSTVAAPSGSVSTNASPWRESATPLMSAPLDIIEDEAIERQAFTLEAEKTLSVVHKQWQERLQRQERLQLEQEALAGRNGIVSEELLHKDIGIWHTGVLCGRSFCEQSLEQASRALVANSSDFSAYEEGEEIDSSHSTNSFYPEPDLWALPASVSKAASFATLSLRQVAALSSHIYQNCLNPALQHSNPASDLNIMAVHEAVIRHLNLLKTYPATTDALKKKQMPQLNKENFRTLYPEWEARLSRRWNFVKKDSKPQLLNCSSTLFLALVDQLPPAP